MKTASWIRNAYKNTKIDWAKSQAELYKKLGEMGIYQIRFTNLKDKFALEFITETEEGQKPRAVRIVVPISSDNLDEAKRTQELNRVHRILLNHLKAKFLAIAGGLTEFDQEFMAHLVITDNKGNSTTMGEMLLPQYNKQLESGKRQDFKLLGNGSQENE